ncbi:helix-turn-helix domain-containing protein [Streptomyces mutabilis]|uniref:Cro/Cl family transcriptional regulator n=1 Tax=Streptomyces mutabilis TaxID=67332 RepID=A0A086MZ13_9ACTN|nr:helix-turn-helix domain-containing protein [Streptomyces mutabilis]KFG74131.1 Cro/Cl family transcriptional regulator [Streptomyces mutabilis]
MTRSPATPLPPPKARRRLRESAALTQAQLAARVGVTRETVRAWESGRTAPRGRNREAYAKLLNALAEEAAARRARPSLTPAPDGNAHPEPERAPVPVVVAVGAGGPRATEEAADSLVLPAKPLGERELISGPESEAESEAESTPAPRPGQESQAEPEPEPEPELESAPEAVSVAESESGSDRQRTPVPASAAALTPEPDRDPGPAPAPVPTPGAEPPQPGPAALTPAQAFDALYEFSAPSLVRQTYLLTGRHELARESVERAFQVAWERWPEVARDRDPVGWVRATAYEYALSPWHRFRLRHRHPEPPPADPGDRTLLNTLLRLPPPHRRTLLLYDGVGLDLPETAAETEASTPTAANRLMRAREALADRLPELADPQVLHRRLAELASAERLRASEPPTVRMGSERRARFLTRAAIAFTVALIGTTALTLRTAPTHYEPPVSPGETVRGVPPRVAPGPLSDEQLELRQKLRDQLQDGPERLAPLVE